MKYVKVIADCLIRGGDAKPNPNAYVRDGRVYHYGDLVCERVAPGRYRMRLTYNSMTSKRFLNDLAVHLGVLLHVATNRKGELVATWRCDGEVLTQPLLIPHDWMVVTHPDVEVKSEKENAA